MDRKEKMRAVAILSLSVSQFVTGAAVSPALGAIRAAFAGTPDLAVQMLISLPAVAIIPASLLSGKLAGRKIRRKTLTLAGTLIYVLGGVGGALAWSMPILLAFRFLLGIGAGILLPLSVSLIADFYTGAMRARLTGYATAVASLGGTVITLGAGALGAVHWRLVFLVYLAMLPAFFLNLRYLTEPESTGSVFDAFRFSPVVIKVSAYMFGITVMVFALPVYLSLYLTDAGLGGPQAASYILVMPNFAGLFAGAVFSDYKRILKGLAGPVALVLMSCGFLVLGSVRSLPLLSLGAFVFGLGLGVLNPLNYLRMVNGVPEADGSFALAVGNAAMYLGQFAAPLIYGILLSTGLAADIRSLFLLNAGASLVMGLVFGLRRHLVTGEVV